jgi:hypothetical protein
MEEGRGEQPVAGSQLTYRESVRGVREDAGEGSGGLLHCSPSRHGRSTKERWDCDAGVVERTWEWEEGP